MDGSQKAKAKAGVTGSFNLVPGGVLQRKRRYVAGRFPLGHPDFTATDYMLGVDPQSVQPVTKQRDSAPMPAQQPPPALIMSNKQQVPGSGPGKQLQGLPRADAGGNYFVLMKAGRDFSVYPLDTSYTFKPIIRSAIQSIDELEAAQKLAGSAGSAGGGAIFMPKSMRQAMQAETATAEADRTLKEEALPILKDKVAELVVKYGNASAGTNRLLDAGSEETESDDMGALEEDNDWAAANKRSKGRGKGKKAVAEGTADKAGKGSTGNPEDELADDIYEGEEDELRPTRPTEDVDWEFAEEAADDDLEQGASEEEGMDDDPGYRKELGLEGDDDEEEAEKEKQEKLAQEAEAAEKAAAAKEAAAAAAATTEGAAAEGEGDEDMLDVDESEFDAEDLDKLAEERERNDESSPPVKKRKRSATPPGAAVAAAATKGSGSKRAATPPTTAVTAAAGRSATPPVGAAAKAAGSRKTPPPATRKATPPPAAAAAGASAAAAPSAKRSRADAAGPAAAAPGAASGLVPWEWTPAQLDASGVPTTDGIIQALTSMGPVPTEQLQLLQERLNWALSGTEGKTVFKKRLLQVAKVGIIADRKYMVLK